MIAPARVAALDALSEVETGRFDLASAVARTRARLHDDRDRALAADIAYGVQRRRAVIDHVIAIVAKRPLDRLDPAILNILRLSVYQLLHLARVPASAVVDDAVDLTRRAGKRSATGFVNAVLRTTSRTRGSLHLPPRPAPPTDRAAALDYLTVTLSHPRWLVERWLDRFGFEATEQWLTFDNEPAPLTLRANLDRQSIPELVERLAAEGVRVTPGRFAPAALVVSEGHPLRGRALEEGRFVVQDEASQLVGLLASGYRSRLALDACASPGGKATAIAAAMNGRGMLVAADVRDRRVDLLRRTVRAAGAENIRVVQADVLAGLPFRDVFQLVLVDAPCSGLGTLRRDPDIKWKRQEHDLTSLAAAQLVMLQHAADVVSPGGHLVYATCSSEPEENEAVADAFVKTTDRFRALDLRVEATALPASVIDGRGHLRTSPPQHGLEAFFAAVFVRAL